MLHLNLARRVSEFRWSDASAGSPPVPHVSCQPEGPRMKSNDTLMLDDVGNVMTTHDYVYFEGPPGQNRVPMVSFIWLDILVHSRAIPAKGFDGFYQGPAYLFLWRGAQSQMNSICYICWTTHPIMPCHVMATYPVFPLLLDNCIGVIINILCSSEESQNKYLEDDLLYCWLLECLHCSIFQLGNGLLFPRPAFEGWVPHLPT